jgi:hypothetical protein
VTLKTLNAELSAWEGQVNPISRRSSNAIHNMLNVDVRENLLVVIVSSFTFKIQYKIAI